MRRTLRSMITELLNVGFEIKFIKRSDGGIIVTEINGKKYKDKSGNQAIRDYLGEKLSESHSRQLQYANERKALYKKRGRPKLPPIPKELLNQQRRINKN